MLDHKDVKMIMDMMFLLLFLLMRIDVNLEGHGGLVGGEEDVVVVVVEDDDGGGEDKDDER